jgi:hypothetical protein
MLEDYRAPFDAEVDGASLNIRNAAIEGVGAIFSTVASLFAAMLQFGLPVGFWIALLYFPARATYRRFRRLAPPAPPVSTSTLTPSV